MAWRRKPCRVRNYRWLWLAPLLAPLLCFADRWSPTNTVIFGDAERYFLPLRWLFHSMLVNGHIHLWNPYWFGGAPLAGNIQAALFYPPNYLVNWLPPLTAHTLFIVAHLGFAGLGMTRLLLCLGHSRVAAFSIGTGYSLSGTSLASIYQINQVAVLAWLPWAAWGAEQYLRGSRRGLVFASVSLGLQLLAGFPQASAYLFVAYALYVWGRALQLGVRARRTALVLALPLLLGSSLAAIQLLPFAELSQHTPRKSLQGGNWFRNDWNWQSQLGYFAPEVHSLRTTGYADPEQLNYLGLVLSGLVLLSLRQRKREDGVWVFAGLFCWLATMGMDEWPGRLVGSLPVLDKFRCPYRMAQIGSFLFPLVAAGYLTGRSGRKQKILALAILTEALIMARAHLLGVPLPAQFAAMPAPIAPIVEAAAPRPRYVSLPGTHDQFANLGLVYGTQNISGCDALPVLNWMHLMVLSQTGHGVTGDMLDTLAKFSFCLPFPNAASPILRLCNLRYVIVPGPQRIDLPAPLERAFFPEKVEVAPFVDQFTPIGAADFQPQQVAYLTQLPDPLPETGGATSCSWLSYSPDGLKLAVFSEKNRLLVLAEPDFPGWEAQLDGGKTALLTCDIGLRGVMIPPGNHVLTLAYHPHSVYWGALISGLTALVLTGLWCAAGKAKE